MRCAQGPVATPVCVERCRSARLGRAQIASCIAARAGRLPRRRRRPTAPRRLVRAATRVTSLWASDGCASSLLLVGAQVGLVPDRRLADPRLGARVCSHGIPHAWNWSPYPITISLSSGFGSRRCRSGPYLPSWANATVKPTSGSSCTSARPIAKKVSAPRWKNSGTISARGCPREKTRTTEVSETTTAIALAALLIEPAAAWRAPSPGPQIRRRLEVDVDEARGGDERAVVINQKRWPHLQGLLRSCASPCAGTPAAMPWRFEASRAREGNRARRKRAFGVFDD